MDFVNFDCKIYKRFSSLETMDNITLFVVTDAIDMNYILLTIVLGSFILNCIVDVLLQWIRQSKDDNPVTENELLKQENQELKIRISVLEKENAVLERRHQEEMERRIQEEMERWIQEEMERRHQEAMERRQQEERPEHKLTDESLFNDVSEEMQRHSLKRKDLSTVSTAVHEVTSDKSKVTKSAMIMVKFLEGPALFSVLWIIFGLVNRVVKLIIMLGRIYRDRNRDQNRKCSYCCLHGRTSKEDILFPPS